MRNTSTSSLEKEQKELSALASTLFQKEAAAIESSIREEFASAGFYLEDEQGDVTNVTINTIELKSPSLLDVDEGSALFSVPVKVDYSADVSYDDFGSGTYDSEDKAWIYLPTKEETVEEKANFKAEVSLQFDPAKPNETVDIESSIPSDFAITVQPTDYELK